MEEIVTMISTVGFPIAMCLLLFWRMREQDDKHATEISALTDTVNKNTAAIEKLCIYLGKEETSNENP